MKKILTIILIIGLTLLSVTGCTQKEDPKVDNKTSEKRKATEDSKRFKEDYESINGTSNSGGQEHRTVNIEEASPFVFSTADEIVEKIDNGETFYVYFGSKYCPWCRSVIEKAIEVANDKNIDKIYYVDIWGEDHEEILRDVYELNSKGKVKKTIDGTKAYYELLEKLSNVLGDYNLTDSDGNKVSVGEKRITAPNYIYIENGKAIELVSGISSKQSGSRDKLTDEILKDEENTFKNFFSR